MIKAVLFDLDGVLIETEYRNIRIKADICRKHGLKWDDSNFYTAAARPFARMLPIMYPELTEGQVKEILDEYRPLGYVGLDYHRLRTAGANELLQMLHDQGYKIAIVSLSRTEKINEVLEVNDWENLIESFVSYDDVEKAKPDPDGYFKAMKKLGVSPDECVIIEDSQVGIEAAKAAGCVCICRRENRYPIEQHGADYYIDDMPEAVRIINEL